MGMGYSAKIARVDLDQGSSNVIEVDSTILRKYIGGVGLAARILWDETSPAGDPFSPENRLMFMIGPLTGKVPQGSRAVVCALSPANNAWGEATMGGTWGAEFGNTGLSGIVVTGRAKRPVYLYIRDDEISIEDASHLWGKDTFEVNDLLQQEKDEKASVAAIGQAGEKQVRIAGIVCDGSLSRVAARCGLGGVMGSKNLKAVVVRGTKKPAAFDEVGLKAINKEVTQFLTAIIGSGPRREPKDNIAHNNKMGDLGVKNQSLGRWDAFVKKIQESYKTGKQLYCRSCPVSCLESHFIEKEGKQIRQEVLQHLQPVGSNCLIDNLDALQVCYERCNRYGIDTISFGYTLSFAMEAFERGLISREDTGGIDLTWGNHEAMLEILRQMAEGEGFGRVLGEGSKRAAEHIGGDAAQYALQVKGLEVTRWDPRIYNSLAIAYATGNKGGSHYESPSHAIERRRPEASHGIDLAEFGYPQGVSRLGFEGKGDIVKRIQDILCLINSLVVCQFSYQAYGVRLATYISWLNAVTGWDVNTDEFRQTGERIFNLKRLINLRRGLSGKDDTLPRRLLTKIPDVSDEEQGVPVSFEKLLQEYYAVRGWASDGSPTREKLAELGLP